MSSNGSNIGYRGTHQIADSHVDFIYQVSTALNMAAAPGLQNTWTKSSNTVRGPSASAIPTSAFSTKSWGKLKFGDGVHALQDLDRPAESLLGAAG